MNKLLGIFFLLLPFLLVSLHIFIQQGPKALVQYLISVLLLVLFLIVTFTLAFYFLEKDKL